MSRLFLLVLTFILGACATTPDRPTPAEWQTAMGTSPPASQKEAEKGVVSFFGTTLKDPESARYTFGPQSAPG
jgi:hypothetical protein